MTAARAVFYPYAEVEEISPQQAYKYLEGNVRNRNIRDAVVEQYARDMKAGNWIITGEAIKFAPDGTLLDGQHRLWAITRAGVPVSMFVARNIVNDAQDVMDTGVKRVGSDALSLSGYQSTTLLAATARLAMAVEAGLTGIRGSGMGNFRVSNSEILSWVQANPDAEDAAKVTAARYSKTLDGSPTAVSYVLMRTRRVDKDKADEFFESMVHMRLEGEGDPRVAAMRFFMRARREQTRINPMGSVGIYLRAWNAWRKGKRVHRFQVESNGKPIRIPDPV